MYLKSHASSSGRMLFWSGNVVMVLSFSCGGSDR